MPSKPAGLSQQLAGALAFLKGQGQRGLIWWAEVSGAAPLRRKAQRLQAEHLAHAGQALSEAEAMRLAMVALNAGDRPRCC